MALYSYVLRFDTGDAPNPYGGVCTLTICKPAIRRTAQVGDWIIGTGSRHSPVGDIAGYLVYAMKVSHKLSLAQYDAYCLQELPIKIPGHPLHHHERENVVGDSLYDYSKPDKPQHRGSLVHSETWLQERDHSGYYALLADHFYYFGKEPRALPLHLQPLVKGNQGHYRRTNDSEIASFEAWLLQQGFERNKVYADPQAPVWQQVERFQESGEKCGPSSWSSLPLLRVSARGLSS
jgi:hypothetical protein